jgi:hypothetical protein
MSFEKKTGNEDYSVLTLKPLIDICVAVHVTNTANKLCAGSGANDPRGGGGGGGGWGAVSHKFSPNYFLVNVGRVDCPIFRLFLHFSIGFAFDRQ